MVHKKAQCYHWAQKLSGGQKVFNNSDNLYFLCLYVCDLLHTLNDLKLSGRYKVLKANYERV